MQKRAYFSTLPQQQLVGLLLTATIRHPELPVFPPNVRNLISDASKTKAQPDNQEQQQQQQQPEQKQQQEQETPPAPQTNTQYQTVPAIPQPSTTSSANGDTLPFSSHAQSELGSAETPMFGESSHQSRTTMDLAGNQYDEDDGYDTDPPAHYPKAGNGLARTLRPESEDLNWLVDDNFEVFSHGWKGDGTGMGADGSLDGLGEGQKVV